MPAASGRRDGLSSQDHRAGRGTDQRLRAAATLGQAARERIEGGLSNETLETAAMTGEPWQMVFAQRRREVEQRRVANMPYDPKSGTPEPAKAPTNPDEE